MKHTQYIYSESDLGVAPQPPKRVLGGTPVSTEWFSDVPTNFGFVVPNWHKKNRYLDQLNQSR